MGKSKKKPATDGSSKPVTLYTRVPPDLAEALDQMLKKTRRTSTAEVIVALEKHLAEAGLWPLKTD